MATTRLTRHINAPPRRVYEALLDRMAVQRWMVPDGMTSDVEVFEPWEGGRFRISLRYDQPTDAGKTDAQTDTFGGEFVVARPEAEVVQRIEFETDDPSMQGEMVITYRLEDVDGGTRLTGTRACRRECPLRTTRSAGTCRSTSSPPWWRAPEPAAAGTPGQAEGAVASALRRSPTGLTTMTTDRARS